MNSAIVRHAGVIAALVTLSLASAARADAPWPPAEVSGDAVGVDPGTVDLAHAFGAATVLPGHAGARPGTTPGSDADPDLDALEDGLRRTDAIGVITKIRLKNRFDALLGDFYRRHQGAAKPGLAALSGRYEALMDLAQSLVRKDDPALHRRLADARRGLWRVMADAAKFAAAELYTPNDPDDALGH